MHCIPFKFEVCKDFKGEAKHIVMWPHYLSILSHIATVYSKRSQRKRYTILVVVIGIVTPQANKEAKIAWLSIRIIVNLLLCMHKELHLFIFSKVEAHMTINCTCISRGKAINF